MKEKEEFKTLEQIWKSIRLILKSHPWHGIEIGKRSPAIVNSYIEIVPTDTVKYEIDKASGYLKVDRPQKYSNICPTPYGFIPQIKHIVVKVLQNFVWKNPAKKES